jgi:hypothetical protein
VRREGEVVEEAIVATLKQRNKILLTKTALKVLFAVLPNPVKFLGQIFLGHGEAIDAERQRLQQLAIIDLLCTIDDAIAQMSEKLRAAQAPTVVVEGLIETHAVNTGAVTGVQVTSDAGPVEFKPGTHILTTGRGTTNLTGLRIGGKGEDKQ